MILDRNGGYTVPENRHFEYIKVSKILLSAKTVYKYSYTSYLSCLPLVNFEPHANKLLITYASNFWTSASVKVYGGQRGQSNASRPFFPGVRSEDGERSMGSEPSIGTCS